MEETNDSGGPLARYTTVSGSYYQPWLHMQRAGGISRFPLYDGVGTARWLVDASATATDAYSLDAFGRYMGGWANPTQNPYRFGAAWGYLTDTPGSGLLQLGARYYWPEVGRFIQQDPARYGINPYLYGRANPLLWVDPTGLWEGGIEGYIGIGAGFYIGQDPCGHFYFKAKAGFGIGGGGGLDPNATSPSYSSGAGRGSFYGLAGQVGLQAGLFGFGSRAAVGNAYDSSGDWHLYGNPPTSPLEPTVGWPPPPKFFGFGAFGGAEGGFQF